MWNENNPVGWGWKVVGVLIAVSVAYWGNRVGLSWVLHCNP